MGKKTVTLHRTDDSFEAFSYIASYAFFVLTHWRSPLTWVTGLALGINVFSLQDYLRSDKAKVEIAKPIGAAISLIPQAIAQSKNEIKIDGKLYGFFDPDVEAWKLVGKPTLLVHQKSTGVVFTVQADALEQERMKSFKK